MHKTVIASVAVASALFLGCGVASADDLSDAINAQSGTPGMVTYLNSLRQNQILVGPEGVPALADLGNQYCGLPPGSRYYLDLALASPPWSAALHRLCIDMGK